MSVKLIFKKGKLNYKFLNFKLKTHKESSYYLKLGGGLKYEILLTTKV